MHAPQSHLRILLCYKNFSGKPGVSHVGLGVSALNAQKCLHRAGLHCDLLAAKSAADLGDYLAQAKARGEHFTHVIVSAPWLKTEEFGALCYAYPRTNFAVTCHSNIGFLQADPQAIKLIREQLALETGVHNFRMTTNSIPASKAMAAMWGDPVSTLPNLYFIDNHVRHSRPGWSHTGGILRIGIFGATRPLKNMLTAVCAAVIIARDLKAHVEIWMNAGRNEGGGSVSSAIKEMTIGMPSVQVKELPWSSWPSFRKHVASMHLLLQPSYTESFNMVTADGVHEGVPSVVSSAIDWAPIEWRAHVDDANDVARKGVALLHDHNAALHGLRALERHNEESMKTWLNFLGRSI
jgi:hypothetical protein